METIPIAVVSPDVVSLSNPSRSAKAIRAVVTLIWPFSSRTSSLSLLLAEHDARLRGSEGQVRVTFQNGAARALSEEHVQIGDEILLNLSGCTFNKSVHSPVGDQNDTMSFETVGGVRTPGKCVSWDLVYGSRLSAKIVRNGIEVADLDVNEPKPISSRVSGLSDPLSSVNRVSTSPHELWGSPAYLKKLRHTHQRYSLPGFDVDFVDDHGSPSTKRRKLSYNRDFWRYVERSPSPRKDVDEADGEESDRLKEVLLSSSPTSRGPKAPSLLDLRKDKLPFHPIQGLDLQSRSSANESSEITESEDQRQPGLQQAHDEINRVDFLVVENDAEETLSRLVPDVQDVPNVSGVLVEDVPSQSLQLRQTPPEPLLDNVGSSIQTQPDQPTIPHLQLDSFTDTPTVMPPPKLTIPNVDPIPELGQLAGTSSNEAPAKPRLEPVPSPSLPLPSPFPREQENSTSYFDQVIHHDSEEHHRVYQDRVASTDLNEPLPVEIQLPDQNQDNLVASPSVPQRSLEELPTEELGKNTSQLTAPIVVDSSSPTTDTHEALSPDAAKYPLEVTEDIGQERQDSVEGALMSKDEQTPVSSRSVQPDPFIDQDDLSPSEGSFRKDALLVESNVAQTLDTPTKPKLSPLTPRNRQSYQDVESNTPRFSRVIKDSEDDYDSQSISTVIPSSSPSRQRSLPWIPPDDLFAVPVEQSSPGPPEVLEGVEEDMSQFFASDDFTFQESEQRKTPQSPALPETATTLMETSGPSHFTQSESQQVQTPKARTTSPQLPELSDIPDQRSRSPSRLSDVVEGEIPQPPISSSRPATPEPSHATLEQQVTDLSLQTENQDSHLLTPVASQRVQKPPVVSSPTSLAQPLEEETADTAPMTPKATQQSIGTAEDDATSKVVEQQLEAVTEPIKTRKRHSDVPRVLSPWFTDGWTRSSQENDPPSTEPRKMPVTSKPILPAEVSFSQRSDASLGLRTSHSYYTPLSGLRPLLNLPTNGLGKHLVDVLAVVMRDSRKPLRASSGPRDWNTIFGITDQFMGTANDNGDDLANETESDSVQRSVQVVIHRPTKNSLPVARKGDVILLRCFTVVSNKGACQLLSTDGSAWAVWSMRTGRDGENGIVKPQMKGPPVEFGLEEMNEVEGLRRWWQQC